MPFTPAPPLPDWLDAQLPFPRRAYVLERGADAGRRLHFLDTLESAPAAAPPVLLLHGNPTWSFLWRRVLPRLEGCRAVAPDLLGLGFSDRLPRLSDHTLARHADAIAELVEALDLRRLTLVGQDWGGPIAAAVGARLPDRVRAAVFANTAVILPRHPRGALFHRLARLPVLSHLLFRLLGLPHRFLHLVQGDPDSLRGPVTRAYHHPLRTWADRAAPLALARMVPQSPGHPSMPELRRGETWVKTFPGPIVLVWGERDPILGRALRRHRRVLPGAPVIQTPAGHFLQEETPEPLADAIRTAALHPQTLPTHCHRPPNSLQ